MARNPTKAVAYYRTSSATNVGADKDSLPRQQEAVRGYAKAAGFTIVDEFYDAAVSGADPIESRPGFVALLDRIEGNGVGTVIIEDESRFARDLLVQELGIMALVQRGVRVLTAGGDDLTATDDPMKVMMRQVAGAFVQFEKARLVAKLRAARERTGHLGGGKPVPAETVAEAKRLARRNPKTGKSRSLRQISAALAELGHLGPAGKPYGAESVKRMVAHRE